MRGTGYHYSTFFNPLAVHPRACGEQVMAESTVLNLMPRFIPAHAGNSQVASDLTKRYSVHPRACGEQLPEIQSPGRSAGSSPRMRGTVRWFPRIRRGVPVHPRACGEQFLQQLQLFERIAVHPRACGEQYEEWHSWSCITGSSPRMRGTDFLYFLKIIDQIH